MNSILTFQTRGEIAIYVLRDPVSGDPRYVGRSKRPDIRLKQHNTRSNNDGLRKWIGELKHRGLYPIMEIIEWCDNDLKSERENFHIAKHLESFPNMLNVGAGRKLGSGHGRTTKGYSVNMTDELWDMLDEIRNGKSRSAWIADKIRKANS